MDFQTQKKIERLVIEKDAKTYKDNGFVRDKNTNELKNGFYQLRDSRIICLKDIGLDHDGNDLPAEKPKDKAPADPKDQKPADPKEKAPAEQDS
jgi:hypothetical protein